MLQNKYCYEIIKDIVRDEHEAVIIKVSEVTVSDSSRFFFVELDKKDKNYNNVVLSVRILEQEDKEGNEDCIQTHSIMLKDNYDWFLKNTDDVKEVYLWQ